MKQIKTLLFAAALFIGATSVSNAQAKIAHINAAKLVNEMPEMLAAKADMTKVGETYQSDIKAMRLELKTKTERYDAEVGSKTQEENEKRYIEVQKDELAIQQYAANAQQELQKKEIELLKPITEKAQAAIFKVAKAKGYTYVLDSAQGGVIMADGPDLYNDVRKELGF